MNDDSFLLEFQPGRVEQLLFSCGDQNFRSLASEFFCQCLSYSRRTTRNNNHFVFHVELFKPTKVMKQSLTFDPDVSAAPAFNPSPVGVIPFFGCPFFHWISCPEVSSRNSLEKFEKF